MFTQRGNRGHVIYAIGTTGDFLARPLDTVESHVCVLRRVLSEMEFDSFLYLSSTRVYRKASNTCEDTPISVSPAEPADLYDIAKLAGESLCHALDRPEIRVARLSNVVGPGLERTPTMLGDLLRGATAGLIEVTGALDSEKDFIWIDDATDILVRIATGGRHRSYNVACGRNIRVGDWVAVLRERTGAGLRVARAATPQRLPPVSVERIVTEFGVRPAPPIDRIDALL